MLKLDLSNLCGVKLGVFHDSELIASIYFSLEPLLNGKTATPTFAFTYIYCIYFNWLHNTQSKYWSTMSNASGLIPDASFYVPGNKSNKSRSCDMGAITQYGRQTDFGHAKAPLQISYVRFQAYNCHKMIRFHPRCISSAGGGVVRVWWRCGSG